MTTLSVTEVRNALRCPRVFALGRRDGAQVAFPVGSSSLGATFHRMLDRFARQAKAPPASIRALPPNASAEAFERALSLWWLDELVAEIEEHPALTSMAREVDDLAEALRQLARYVGERLSEGRSGAEGDAAARVSAFFAASELELEVVLAIGERESVTLRGRIDALFLTPGKRLEVVEYKLTSDENEANDVAQVALYRTMLARDRRIDAEAVILRFAPNLSETRIDSDRADELVQARLVPLIRDMVKWCDDPHAAPAPPRADFCAACPLRRPCIETYTNYLPSRDDPPAGACRPRPTPSGGWAIADAEVPPAPHVEPDVEGREEAHALERDIEEVLSQLGVAVRIQQPTLVGARLLRVEVAASRAVRRLDSSAEDLRHQLHQRGIEAFFEKLGGQRVIYAARRKPRAVSLGRLLHARASWLAEEPGRFVIGEGLDGTVLSGDFAEPVTAHLLIGGATGSGKSVLLRGILASLVQFHGPEAVQLTLVDPKRVTFTSASEGFAAHLAEPVCFDVEDAVRILDDLVIDMERRYELFEAAKVEDLAQLNEGCPATERLARRVVVIDEFQDLVADNATRGPFEAAIQRLGAKARAAGIHLVLATQHPVAKVVRGSIKANLTGRIALRVQDVSASRVILDASGAQGLLGKGDLLASLGRGLVRAQAAFA